MLRRPSPALLVVLAVVIGMPSQAADPKPRDEANYVNKTRYPVLEEMDAARKAKEEAARELTGEILARIAEEQQQREDQKKELRPDISGLNAPAGPAAFSSAWHFPPTPQYYTSACWSFSATSFLESEIKRLHGREVKLSEMWTVYWEFVDKARRFVERRGKSRFTAGSESNAIYRIYREYGAVPRTAYEGTVAEDGRFDHVRAFRGMRELLAWCGEHELWDEDLVLALVRQILDRTMGRPPASFPWNGNTYTPAEFRDAVCALDLEAYVSVMSTMSVPFWTLGRFDVPDNWWDDETYLNLPLEIWYEVITTAVDQGHTLVIGGDVSEPGLYGLHDVAFIPSFDIPAPLIDQSARELRIWNHTTTDDHGVHLVGHVRHAGHDWFLVKDSNRSSRLGKHKGYYMYRDDYVRLKMLTLGVHRDVVAPILERHGKTSVLAGE